MKLRGCFYVFSFFPIIVATGLPVIGEYFLEHAKAAYSLIGTDPVNKQGEYLLNTIQRNGIAEFPRRDAMRLCRGFKTAESIQPVLNRLCEYGYIAAKPTETTAGPADVPPKYT